MALDPVEYVVIAFPGERLGPGVLPALADVVDRGLIRILDLVVVTCGPDGVIGWAEFDAVPEAADLAAIDGEAGGLLAAEDLEAIGATLPPSSTALVVVWEDLWARGLNAALQAAGGELVAGQRLSAEVVEAALARYATEEDAGC